MMQNNLKLKRAVAIAIGVFAMSAQQQVLALGLGEINVQSHLGQPLRAKVKVHGAGDLTSDELNEKTCFKLGDSSDGMTLSSVNFKLGAITNDEAMLSLSTTQIVNEPILNLAIIAECGSSVRRDYVVLLDPVLTTEADNIAEEESAPSVTTEPVKPKKSAKKNRHLTDSNVALDVAKNSKGKKKFNENKQLITDNANIVLHVPGGNTESQTKAAENNPLKSNQPHLSISGGEVSAATPLNTGNLRLDKQLTLTPDANAQPIVSDADMQDEVTAMNNRLAHLSAQVAKLQSRNLVLESENKFKTTQVLEAESSKNQLRWLGYVLGAALVFVSLQLAKKWHWRREYEKLLANSEPSWAVSKEAEANPNTLTNPSQEDEFLLDDTRQNSNNIVEKSAIKAVETAQNVEAAIMLDEAAQDLSILDHADVFLSHGRSSLAIQLLQNHLLDHPKQSITIWLFLLDLLAKENLPAVYEQTALECKEHFNIKIAEFAKGNKDANQNFESFPHLTEGLQQVWGTPASVAYLDDLIYNNRLEPRAGLDKNLIEELLLLKTIAQENVNSAEVIHLDEKKVAMQEQKEAMLAAKKAEKLQKMDEAFEQEKNKTSASEKLYEFGLVEWK